MLNVSTTKNSALILKAAACAIILVAGTVANVYGQCVDNFFEVKQTIDAGDSPISMIFADFNRDSIQDMATADSLRDTVDVRLGNGLGGYGPLLPPLTVGDRPEGVVTADFNRDGKPDIAVANRLGYTISVAHGNGDGTFATPTSLSPGGEPTSMATADFNRDGKMDLAVAMIDLAENGVVIFYGNSSGFDAPMPVENVGFFPRSIIAADMDLDRTTDLVILYRDPPPISVDPDIPTPPPGAPGLSINYKDAFGTGFSAVREHAMGTSRRGLAIGKLNGDAFPDIATANGVTGEVSVLIQLNPWDYEFRTMDGGDDALFVAIGDVSQDGKADIVVANRETGATVLRGDGSGHFPSTSSIALTGFPYALAITDFNLDAKPDLVVSDLVGGVVTVVENTCGHFSGAVSGLTTGPQTISSGGRMDVCGLKRQSQQGYCTMESNEVKFVDPASGFHTSLVINSGVVLDAVVMEGSRDAVVTYKDGNSLKAMYFQMNTEGAFEAKASTVINVEITSEITGALAQGDMDGDGTQEYMVADADANVVQVLTVDDRDGPSPTFTTTNTISVGLAPTSIISEDFNKDGLSDVMTKNSVSGDLSLYKAVPVPAGLFAKGPVISPQSLAAEYIEIGTDSGKPTTVTAADVNNDGNLDVIVGTESGIQLLTGTESGSYNPPQTVSTGGEEVIALDTGDMNVDGKTDIVAVTTNTTTGVPKLKSFINTNEQIAQPILSTVSGPSVAVAPDTVLLVTSVDGDAQPDVLVKPAQIDQMDSFLGTVYAAPIAAGDQFSVDLGATLNIAVPGVIDNDVFPTNAAVVAELVSGPVNSTGFALNTDGSFDYTAANLNGGTDSFSYKLVDGSFESETVTVTFNINAVNSAPAAINDSATTDEDTQLLGGSLLANDTDGESDALTAVLVSGPAQGTLTLNQDSSYSYTPSPNFNGTDSFTYKANDGSLDSNVATVTITVNPVNDDPNAADDSAIVAEDIDATAIVVLDNDSADPDTDETLSISGVTQGTSGGVVAITGAGTGLTYAPAANFHGSDSFTYTVSDGNGGFDMATVSITVSSVNDAPTAVDDSATVAEDAGVSPIDVRSNDADADGDTLSITAVTQGASGLVAITGAGVSYTPNTNFSGSDSFSYTVSDGTVTGTATVAVTVTPVNDAPDAVNDSKSVAEDSMDNAINFLANDTDIDGDMLSVTAVTQPANGSVTATPTGVSFTPNANFNGTDSFTYTISDGSVETDTATVSVTVSAVNDAPAAAAQLVETDEDNTKTITMSGSDVDGDGLSYSADQPSHGSVSCTGETCVYTPAENYNGPDSFTFTANDGQTDSPATVSITVNPVNDAPAATAQSVTTAEDIAKTITLVGSDPDDPNTLLTYEITGEPTHGTLTGTGANRTYTPEANFSGSDTFTFRVSDGSLESNTATVNVAITSVDDAPMAAGESFGTNEDTPLTILAPGILSNDSDIEGGPLAAVIVSGPAHGSLMLGPNGSFSYTPHSNFYGIDSFTYKANDGSLDSNVATVTIAVNAVNDAPTVSLASPTTQTVQYSDQALDVSWSATDVDSTSLMANLEYSFNGGAFAPLSASDLQLALSVNCNAGTCSASVSGSINIPAGVYRIRFKVTDAAGSTSYSADHVLTVTQEYTATEFTGDVYALTAGPTVTTASVRLAAQLTQDADGSLGDITKAKVSFLLFKAGNLGSTPDAVITGVPVDESGAALTFANLAVDTWTVKVKVDAGNGYWKANPVGMSTITIEQPTTELRTSGGGWVADTGSVNGKGNFAFNVANQKKGVRGSSIYLFRGLDGFNYLVKSTSWNNGGIGFRNEGNVISLASFSGKCVVQKIDAATGEVVESFGNYSYTVDVRDGDLFAPRQPDKYAITILNSSGLIWRQVGSRSSPLIIGGGNVTVKGK